MKPMCLKSDGRNQGAAQGGHQVAGASATSTRCVVTPLHKLERRANVPSIKGRGFHAFRRAVSTALVERLGVSHASRIVGDTPEVLLRHYVKPTSQAEAEGLNYLAREWLRGPEWQRNGIAPGEASETTPPTPLATGTYGTGPAGLEPATPGFGDRCSAS